MSNRVLLVHGLWMRSFSMLWLANRLRGQGFETELFGYYSLLQDTDAVVARMAGILRDHPGANVVAHSLGGLLSLRAAEQVGIESIGRIVCLGSPLAGSQAAASIVSKIPAGATIVGHNRSLLAAGIGQIPAGLQVGAVAGCVPRGLGGVMAHFACEHDGTVAIPETRVPGLTDHAVVHASHSGLLFSDAAACRATEFLREGRFQHAGEAGAV